MKAIPTWLGGLCVLLAGLLMGGSVISGCASTPKGNPMPPDFSLSLSVSGSGEGDLQPAWYVVGPDWVLRTAVGERTPNTPLPGAVRTISRQQAEHLWELAYATGVLDEDNPAGRAVGDDWVPKAGSGPAAVIYLAGRGLRRTRVIEGPASDSAVAALAHELKGLSWIK
ncbi:MAG: hypothetical protein GC200_11035 [Tepidisphaera sp.]|nr:hypothetical protein [Tepidisphaera sp.]